MLLKTARKTAGLSQRDLARKARTAQSVVARIELGETNPALGTLQHLVHAAGFEIAAQLQRIPHLDRSVMEDVTRILGMSPEERLREIGQISRFVTVAKRV